MITFNQNTTSTSFLSTGEAAERLGVSVSSVKNYLADGTLKGYVTRGGHNRVDLRSVVAYLTGQEESDQTALENEARQTAAYIRVSSQSQASDGSLARQQTRLLEEISTREGISKGDVLVYKDIASSFGSRDGLNKLVDDIIDGKIGRIYVEYQDRLSRVGCLTRLVEHLCKRYNVEIVCLDIEETDQTDNAFFMKELMDYMVCINNRISAAKSRRVTEKHVNEETAKRVLNLRGQGYSVSKIAQIAKSEGLKNERGEILSSYMVEKVVYSPEYTALAVIAQPTAIAREWIVSHVQRVDGSRILNKELIGAYEASCVAKGIKPIAKSDFGIIMVEVFGADLRFRTMATTAWRGLALVG